MASAATQCMRCPTTGRPDQSVVYWGSKCSGMRHSLAAAQPRTLVVMRWARASHSPSPVVSADSSASTACMLAFTPR